MFDETIDFLAFVKKLNTETMKTLQNHTEGKETTVEEEEFLWGLYRQYSLSEA